MNGDSIRRFLRSPRGRVGLVGALVCYWGLLAVGTHLPAGNQPGIPHLDKVLHFTAYCGLGVLLTTLGIALDRRWTLVGVLVVIAIYGAMDELLQIPVGRSCDILDWIADMVGATLGASLTLRWLGGRDTDVVVSEDQGD